MAGVNLVLISKENEEDLEDIKKDFKDLFDENFKYKIINNLSEAINEFII
jgi:hypothetical protein